MHDERIPAPRVQELLETLNGFACNISMYRQYGWYTEAIDRRIRQEMAITGAAVTETCFDSLLRAGFRPNKLLCMGTAAQIAAAEQHLRAFGYDDLNIHKSKTTYLEIMNRSASKRRGIEKVLEAYALISHQSRDHHGTELAAFLHRDHQVAQAQQRIHDMIRDLITAATKAGEVRDDVSSDELAAYCINALKAAHHVGSKAAVHRLVTVTLAGMQATT